MAGRRPVHPWANIALAGLIGLQLATGLAGLLGAGSPFRVLFWLHAVGAYAIVALLAAKAAIVLTALRRRPGLGVQRLVLLVLVVLLLATLVSGLTWIAAGPIAVAGISLVNLHAYLALALTLLLLWHLLDRRWVTRMPEARDRAAFLRIGATALAGVILWQVERTAQALLETGGSRRRFTGSYERVGSFPATSWLDDDPEPIEPGSWRLRVTGAVQQPLELARADLDRIAPASLRATLDCTSGWYTDQRWDGIPLAALLDRAGVGDGARSVVVISATGYARRFSIEHARSLLLATDVAGTPLTHGHGFPLRLVVPGRRGFEWVKWVERLEVSGRPHFLQSPLPLS